MVNRIWKMLGLDAGQENDHANRRAEALYGTMEALVNAGFSREEAMQMMSRKSK